MRGSTLCLGEGPRNFRIAIQNTTTRLLGPGNRLPRNLARSISMGVLEAIFCFDRLVCLDGRRRRDDRNLRSGEDPRAKQPRFLVVYVPCAFCSHGLVCASINDQLVLATKESRDNKKLLRRTPKSMELTADIIS